jgi:hypothetical protein
MDVQINYTPIKAAEVEILQLRIARGNETHCPENKHPGEILTPRSWSRRQGQDG